MIAGVTPTLTPDALHALPEADALTAELAQDASLV